jgi:hypothetical protein
MTTVSKLSDERVIFSGPRDATVVDDVETVLRNLFTRNPQIEIVVGDAPGVDGIVRDWAVRNSVPIKVFRADWNKNGRAAGPMRNKRMAEYGTSLVAFQYLGRKTPGTQSMIREAAKKQLHTMIVEV